MAHDYRQSGIDYRASGVTYQGAFDVTVTPATVAAVGAVPSVTVTSIFNVDAGVVAATAAVPAPSLYTGINLSPSAVAGVGAVPGATVSGGATVTAGTVAGTGAVPAPALSTGAVLTPGVVAGVGAIPSVTVLTETVISAATVAGTGAVPAPTTTGTAAVTPDTVATVAACSSFTDVTELFTSPTTDTLPNLAKGETDYQPHAAKNRLARFYAPRAKGGNVWILSDTTVTTTQPMTEADIATITRTLYGGHDYPDDLSETEAALLVAAGQSVDVEVR
jgi:hypothetical protein